MNSVLKNYIRKSGYKLKYIAELLGLTYPGFYNKLMSKSEFTVKEALKLQHILNITDEDFKVIFDETLSASDRIITED